MNCVPSEDRDQQMGATEATGGSDPDELLQMFSSITTTDHDELVDQFAFLLEVDVGTATFFLESSNWNIELAANNYFNTLGSNRVPCLLGLGDSEGRDDRQEMEFEEQGDAQNDRTAWWNGSGPSPQAKLLTDLSFTQQSVYPPNARVSITVEFENTSESAWPPGTTLSFYQGDTNFEAPHEIKVAAAPKSRIQIHIDCTMPGESGSFSASWCLRTWQGYFGEPVWVVFNVQQPATLQLQGGFHVQQAHFQLPVQIEQQHGIVAEKFGSQASGQVVLVEKNEDDQPMEMS